MRILLISRHFLDGSSEGLCAARTAGALAGAGHRVVVVANPGKSGADSRMVRGLDEVKVVPVTVSLNRYEQAWAYCNNRASRTWLHRTASAALNLRHFSTSKQWAWVRLATAAGLREVALAEENSEPFDVVFSRLNPVESHQAAQRILLQAKRALHAPPLGWCAYFSDPWPHHTYPSPFRYSAGPLSRRRGLSVLRSFARTADSLLFPSERLAAYMAPFMTQPGRMSRSQVEKKSYIAPHMGLASDVDFLEPAANEKALKIRHAGLLMGERRVTELFEALGRLPSAVRRELRLEFMGRRGQGEHSVPAELAGSVSFLDARPPDQAFEWICGAHVALLVESDFAEGIFMPSKFAEYVSVGRPVLALSPEHGTVADFLSGGGGLRVGPASVEEITEGLLKLHRQWKAGSLAEMSPRPELREKFRPQTVLPQVERALRAAAEVSDS